MKIKFTIATLLVFSILVFSAQDQGSKKNKIQLKQAMQKTSVKIDLQANAIGKKFKEFLDKTGNKPAGKKNSIQSRLNSVISKSGSNLKIPDLKAGQNKKIKRVLFDDLSGTPRLIELKPESFRKNLYSSLAVLPPSERAINFLIESKSLLRISDPAKEFIVKSEQKDELGMTHIRLSQSFKGIEVWGKEVYVHFDKLGNLTMMNGRFEATPEINDTNGKISAQEAINIAANDAQRFGRKSIPQKIHNLMDYDGPSAEKVIWFRKTGVPQLVYHVEIMAGLSHHMNYFVDAGSGEIVNSYNEICYSGSASGSGTDLNGVAQTFGIYQSGSDYYMIDISQPMFNEAGSKLPDEPAGGIVTFDLRNHDLSNEATIYHITSQSPQWNNPTAVSAHYNAIVTYNYFRAVHNRNSIDDKGGTFYSIINVTEGGQPMENAFFAGGKFMCYGNGGAYFKPLAGALDVSAHEMTHGVVQYSAGLEYQDQQGALNESMADVFGVVVDSLNWTLAENIIKDLNTFPSGAMRDVSNPHNGSQSGSGAWQPAKMSEFVNTTQDHGGVHTNSGIPNRAFYLTATSIGRSKGAQIWYRALTNYLTRTSQFIDARIATVKAAADLYGESGAEVAAVKSAWDNVEVYEAGGTTPPDPTSVVGEDWILVSNTDPNDPNSLYMVKSTLTSNSDIIALSSTKVFNRPSVTDTSGIVVFIDEENNLRALYADPQNPQETVLDESGTWWSVAVGPGLNYLALTSIYSDTSIYYFDFVNEISSVFKIAIQSFDGEEVKTALFADALSFDPSGEYLLFDAYNEIRNSSGDTLSYWNVNLLDLNSGKMQSVFPPLKEGISLGNPAFSKTSPNRFTFDYWEEEKDEYYVLAVDFNENLVGTVAGPLNTLGYPTYSGDDKTIAYHTILTEGQYTNHSGINQMPLEDNFIEGKGVSMQYLVDASYPIWFVIGSRVTGVDETTGIIPEKHLLYQNYPNPFNPVTNIKYTISEPGNVTIKIYDILGKEVATLLNEEKPVGEYNIQFDGSSISSGVYIYTLNSGSFKQSRAMVLMK